MASTGTLATGPIRGIVRIIAHEVPSTLLGFTLGEVLFGAGLVGALAAGVVTALAMKGVFTGFARGRRGLDRLAEAGGMDSAEAREAGLGWTLLIVVATAALAAGVTSIIASSPEAENSAPYWGPILLLTIAIAGVLAVSGVICVQWGARATGIRGLGVLAAEVAIAFTAAVMAGEANTVDSDSIVIPASFAMAFIVLQATNPFPWMCVGAVRQALSGPAKTSAWSALTSFAMMVVVGLALIGFVAMTLDTTFSGVEWALGQGDDAATWHVVAGGALGLAGGVLLGGIVAVFILLAGVFIFPATLVLGAWAAWALTRGYGTNGLESEASELPEEISSPAAPSA